MNSPRYAIAVAQIAIPGPFYHLFDYRIPAHIDPQILIAGIRVKVPFGRRKLVGIVINQASTTPIAPNKLKSILDIIDQQSLFNDELYFLLCWASHYYHHPIGEVLFESLPILLRQGKAAKLQQAMTWCLTSSGKHTDVSKALKRAPQQQRVIELLNQYSTLTTDRLKQYTINASSLTSLQKKGWIKKTIIDKPIDQPCNSSVALNSAQRQTTARILSGRKSFQVYLLHGVTGSGKTEVYLRTLGKLLQTAGQALVLLPEISLTPQTLKRFQQRLPNSIALYHSQLTPNQRLQIWLQVKQEKIHIIIGTRSAIFLPFQQLKCIIIDEEHDPSFKQQDGFRYHARDIAIKRAQAISIPIILGSATPSLESYFNSQQQRYHYLHLSERAGQANLPNYQLIDMRGRQLTHGFSTTLITAIKHTLARQEQVLLFLNRRGFAPIYLCHDCSWVADCQRCDAHLTFHYGINQLRCHHCNKFYPLPDQCPECLGKQLVYVGLGTERIEQAIQQLFPQSNSIRIDRDTTRHKTSLQRHFDKIHQKQVDILIGTQMLAKGHDFPNVTLVAILNMDQALFSMDFRAIERMGQLLTQVAGRAGRANKPGQVFIQTYQAQHSLLQILIQHDYSSFADQLLHQRKKAILPPFTHCAVFHVEARQPDIALNFLQKLVKQLPATFSTSILGPAPNPMTKRAGYFRAQILVKNEQRKLLHQIIEQLLQLIVTNKQTGRIRWSLDVDPNYIF